MRIRRDFTGANREHHSPFPTPKALFCSATRAVRLLRDHERPSMRTNGLRSEREFVFETGSSEGENSKRVNLR